MTINYYLGDTHLGKQFQAGVPLHRRGDREATQWADFEASLNHVSPGDLHIQVGDLFDKAYVGFNVIARTAQMYRDASKAHPDVVYIINRGNHDASRDLERVSAYRIFAMMMEGTEGVTVVEDVPMYVGNIMVVPWHPVKTALEMIEDMEGGVEVVTGHWDVVAIGDTTNLIPAGRLLELGVKRAVTGHDHLARELVIEGLPVTVVGSMQPYSHAEDPAERIYVTRTLTEVLTAPDSFHDKCLRIVLEPTEVFDVVIDCLALSLQRGKDEGAEAVQVDFEEFDFEALLNQACAEIGLSTDMITTVSEKLEAERAAKT
jgi:DNA repair exonuclease SbcCD nuclease subunit